MTMMKRGHMYLCIPAAADVVRAFVTEQAADCWTKVEVVVDDDGDVLVAMPVGLGPMISFMQHELSARFG